MICGESRLVLKSFPVFRAFDLRQEFLNTFWKGNIDIYCTNQLQQPTPIAETEPNSPAHMFNFWWAIDGWMPREREEESGGKKGKSGTQSFARNSLSSWGIANRLTLWILTVQNEQSMHLNLPSTRERRKEGERQKMCEKRERASANWVKRAFLEKR